MEDWEMVLGSKAEVVIKYGEAKRLVLKERSERQKESNEDVHDKNAVVDDPISETGFSDERDVTIPLETVTVPLLASLSAEEIVRNLSSSYGSRILLKLGLKTPSEQEKNSLLAWRTRVASKGKVIMRTEIVGMLERHAVVRTITQIKSYEN